MKFGNLKKNKALLQRFLPYLRSEGYEFVGIDSLIYKDNFYIDVTGKQIKKS